ncbi:MAG: fimbrillin family protein [Bacteroidales bacterium]|nr:fimbrillin family protein [Bacteroidales bacterium]MDD3299638.1 fimbrillin family protein [Bacteroidales bacterium]MDD4618053.1 fimbrillin family protein [Bacteroidales bacterium]
MKKLGIIIAVVAQMCLSCSKHQNFDLNSLQVTATFSSTSKASAYPAMYTKANLYTFQSTPFSTTNKTQGVVLSAGINGIMNPNKEYYLLKGSYDIYSLSQNSNRAIDVMFDGNMKCMAQNHIDYIWASAKRVYVKGPTPVQLNFKHMACCVQININPPDNYNNMVVNHIKMTLPNPQGTELDLLGGTVTTSQNLLPASTIQGSGLSRSLFLLPCSQQPRVEVSVNATINNITTNGMVYSGTIPSSLVAGNKYTVELNLKERCGVNISVGITPWNYQNETIEYSFVRQ